MISTGLIPDFPLSTFSNFLSSRLERGKVSPALAGSQMKLRPRAGAAGIPGMRCLGIDYGARRIGLSYGDDLGVATPLPALTEADDARRWASLAAVVRQRKVTDLVLGYPFNMDDSVGFKAKEVDAFAANLRAEFGLPVHLVDERLTSYEAESTIAKSKRRDVRASGVIDSRAATLILQDFLNQKFGLPPPEGEGERMA
jgi:putative holliday junction resolvase